MTYDEFVEIHGEEVWIEHVKPIKDCSLLPSYLRNNANFLVDYWIKEGKNILQEISELTKKEEGR